MPPLVHLALRRPPSNTLIDANSIISFPGASRRAELRGNLIFVTAPFRICIESDGNPDGKTTRSKPTVKRPHFYTSLERHALHYEPGNYNGYHTAGRGNGVIASEREENGTQKATMEHHRAGVLVDSVFHDAIGLASARLAPGRHIPPFPPPFSDRFPAQHQSQCPRPRLGTLFATTIFAFLMGRGCPSAPLA